MCERRGDPDWDPILWAFDAAESDGYPADDARNEYWELRTERDRYRKALEEIGALEDCGDYYHDYCHCLEGSEYRPRGAKRIVREALDA